MSGEDLAPSGGRAADRAREITPDRWLETATWGYLALPVALFLIGWVRWPLAVVAVAGLGVAVVRAASQRFESPVGDRPRLIPARLIPARLRPARLIPARLILREGAILGVTATAVGGVLALNGTGGFGYQSWDWLKHTAILRDLIDAPWPVVYEVGGERVGLVYYLAWYLPAALAGKLFGWVAAHLAQIAWTTIGGVLCVGWLRGLSGARWWLALLVFVLFSGLDLIGAAVHPPRPGAPPMWTSFDLEWWAIWWAYESNVSHLAYAPHQAVGGWLITSLLLHARRRSRPPAPLVPLVAIGLIWSPFAVLGGLVFLGVDGLLLRRDPVHVDPEHVDPVRVDPEHLEPVRVDPVRVEPVRVDPVRVVRDLATTANLAALPALVIVVAYLAAHFAPPVALEAYRPATIAGGPAWTFERASWPAFLGGGIVFAITEFLALAAALWWALRTDRQRRREVLAAACVLLALPWVSYGYYNDLSLRASLPALFVLQVALLGALARWRERSRAAIATLLVLALAGAVFPANQLRLRALQVWQRRDLVEIPSRALAPDLFEQQRTAPEGLFFVGQYVGSVEAPFFRWLAAPAEPIATD